MTDSKIIKVIKYVTRFSGFLLEHIVDNNNVITSLVFKNLQGEMLIIEINRFTVGVNCKMDGNQFNVFFEQEINEYLSDVNDK